MAGAQGVPMNGPGRQAGNRGPPSQMRSQVKVGTESSSTASLPLPEGRVFKASARIAPGQALRRAESPVRPSASNGSFVQPAPMMGANIASAGSFVQPGALLANGAEARNSMQPIVLEAKVLQNPSQVDAGQRPSPFANVLPSSTGNGYVEPMQPLPTRYSTGSWVAPPKESAMPNQTALQNEAGGNAVVMNLKSRLEDVQNVLNSSMRVSDLNASIVTALPRNSTSPATDSELTEAAQAAQAEQAAQGDQWPSEELEAEQAAQAFFVDEFEWDVYDAAARLAERIKAAAGLALLRDSLGMSVIFPSEQADVNGGDEIFPSSGTAAGSGRVTQPDATQSSEEEAKTNERKVPLFASSGDRLSNESAFGTANAVRNTSSNSTTNATAEAATAGEALVPPRVSDGTEGGTGSVLLVGASEMEETWVLIDGFRVRVEMLPGGLLPERDTIFEELNFLLSGLQNWEPGSDAGHSMPSFLQLSEMVSFSSRVQELEAHYQKWAEDKEQAPFDDASKQRVCDWLGEEGEKDHALESLRSAGARRCKGPEAEHGGTCRKLLRHELYKRNAQRCPLCKKPSKRAMAADANQKLARAEVAGLMSEGSAEEAAPKAEEKERSLRSLRRLVFEERFVGNMEVEARETAFALFVGEPNTYYRCLVLPSDVEYHKEMKTPATVTWLDVDNSNRGVNPFEIVFLGDDWAQEVQEATVAHWENSAAKLMPGGHANAQIAISVDPA